MPRWLVYKQRHQWTAKGVVKVVLGLKAAVAWGAQPRTNGQPYLLAPDTTIACLFLSDLFLALVS